jgi:hypothetical protein
MAGLATEAIRSRSGLIETRIIAELANIMKMAGYA